MKYLKTYESLSITDDLRDILLEIEDIGYRAEVDEITILPYPRTIGKNKKEISITLQEPENSDESRSESDISGVYDVLERIDEYMTSHKWTLCRINEKDIVNNKSSVNLSDGLKELDWKTQLFLTLYASSKVTLYYKPMIS